MRGAAGNYKSGKQSKEPRIRKIFTLPDKINQHQRNGIISERDQQIWDDMKPKQYRTPQQAITMGNKFFDVQKSGEWLHFSRENEVDFQDGLKPRRAMRRILPVKRAAYSTLQKQRWRSRYWPEKSGASLYLRRPPTWSMGFTLIDNDTGNWIRLS